MNKKFKKEISQNFDKKSIEIIESLLINEGFFDKVKNWYNDLDVERARRGQDYVNKEKKASNQKILLGKIEKYLENMQPYTLDEIDIIEELDEATINTESRENKLKYIKKCIEIINEYTSRHIAFLLKSAGIESFGQYVHKEGSRSKAVNAMSITGKELAGKFLKNTVTNPWLDSFRAEGTNPDQDFEAADENILNDSLGVLAIAVTGLISNGPTGLYPISGYDPEFGDKQFSPVLFGEKWAASKSGGWMNFRPEASQVTNKKAEQYLMHKISDIAAQITGPDDLLSKLNIITVAQAQQNQQQSAEEELVRKILTIKEAVFDLEALRGFIEGSSVNNITKIIVDEVILETLINTGNKKITVKNGNVVKVIDAISDQLSKILSENNRQIREEYKDYIGILKEGGATDAEIKVFNNKNRNKAVRSLASIGAIIEFLKSLSINQAPGVLLCTNLNDVQFDLIKTPALDDPEAPYEKLFDKEEENNTRAASFLANKDQIQVS